LNNYKTRVYLTQPLSKNEINFVAEKNISRPLMSGSKLDRIKAAGICHSDAHYLAGMPPGKPLPLTLGHKVAGVVPEVGSDAEQFEPGDRVCLPGACSGCQPSFLSSSERS
jgi:D-arabinose 1-dehydrogenase-like Zn-dependent alcohol dehydrogenase